MVPKHFTEDVVHKIHAVGGEGEGAVFDVGYLDEQLGQVVSFSFSYSRFPIPDSTGSLVVNVGVAPNDVISGANTQKINPILGDVWHVRWLGGQVNLPTPVIC